MRWLSVVGYYRLSGYLYAYRVLPEGSQVRLDTFRESTTFDQVIALYDFDRRLKLLMLDALERIEIAVRFRVGYTLPATGRVASEMGFPSGWDDLALWQPRQRES